MRQGSRVCIVDDHALFAESLEIALRLEGHEVRRLPLPKDLHAAATLLPQVQRYKPDIMLLDLDLGNADGSTLIEPATKSGTAVVVVTGSTDRARWGLCMRYGARKVLPKTGPLNDILATIRRISEGRTVTTQEERDELVRFWQDERKEVRELGERLSRLTQRESQVLGMLMEGLQVRDIAVHSTVSEATVRTQVKSILSKLEVTSQLAAVGLAHHAGWHAPQQS
ncbi:LuxR C-terminal-related transcriptional regulator [uncultured Nocardioides sp.]|uniref:LuxR C-terminal-related transcriptional regulator n=1 Tax=uncultured Nocardioides sp. TaxID=198441 RepID=UPI0025F749B0|nr:response regulator transcription factor [uncultured Nocardioides sp.]